MLDDLRYITFHNLVAYGIAGLLFSLSGIYLHYEFVVGAFNDSRMLGAFGLTALLFVVSFALGKIFYISTEYFFLFSKWLNQLITKLLEKRKFFQNSYMLTLLKKIIPMTETDAIPHAVTANFLEHNLSIRRWHNRVLASSVLMHSLLGASVFGSLFYSQHRNYFLIFAVLFLLIVLQERKKINSANNQLKILVKQEYRKS